MLALVWVWVWGGKHGVYAISTMWLCRGLYPPHNWDLLTPRVFVHWCANLLAKAPHYFHLHTIWSDHQKKIQLMNRPTFYCPSLPLQSSCWCLEWKRMLFLSNGTNWTYIKYYICIKYMNSFSANKSYIA